MDSITQAALGATVAAAGFRETLGPKAVGLGLLVGTLPDLDIFTRALGPWASLRWHRGPTHSLLVLPLLAPVVGWICWRLAKRDGPLRSWIHLAFWCLVTHPLLDLFTSYGTQLFSPFTDRRFAIDGVAIIDPLYTAPLLAALAVGLVASISVATKVRAARLALLVSTIYLGVGTGFGELVRLRAHRQLATTPFRATRIRATPTFFNNLLWHVVAQDDARNLLVGQASVLRDRPIAFRSIPWTEHPMIDRALETPEGRLFRWFAASTLSARVEIHPGGTRVHFRDHRYGLGSDPARSPFGAVSAFDASGRYLGTRRVRPVRDLKPRDEVAHIWRRIWAGADEARERGD